MFVLFINSVELDIVQINKKINLYFEYINNNIK